MKNKYQGCFVGIQCVNGTCPRSLAFENDKRDDDALCTYEGDKKLKCKDCAFFVWSECKDCYFYGEKECPEYENKNN